MVVVHPVMPTSFATVVLAEVATVQLETKPQVLVPVLSSGELGATPLHSVSSPMIDPPEFVTLKVALLMLPGLFG